MSMNKRLLLPFSLTIVITVLDQISKALVVKFVSQNSIAFSFFGDFLWLTHQRNLGIAFSFLDNLPNISRVITLVLLPFILIVLVIIYYFKVTDLKTIQRWALCGIIGGGVGNLIDRAFKPNGVVDFISLKFYGLFGFERWPTFNIADLAVVVSIIIILISTIYYETKNKHAQKI